MIKGSRDGRGQSWNFDWRQRGSAGQLFCEERVASYLLLNILHNRLGQIRDELGYLFSGEWLQVERGHGVLALHVGNERTQRVRRLSWQLSIAAGRQQEDGIAVDVASEIAKEVAA